MNEIEEKRKRLDYELRFLLSAIDKIDGLKGDYPVYQENTKNEEEYLDEEIMLVVEAKTRLMNIFM